MVELSAREARRIVAGDRFAKKFDVAQAIARNHFPQLACRLPPKPPHAVLGYGDRDRYRLHMFDALAVALAAAATSARS